MIARLDQQAQDQALAGLDQELLLHDFDLWGSARSSACIRANRKVCSLQPAGCAGQATHARQPDGERERAGDLRRGRRRHNYLGGVYQYDPSNGALARIAQHDPDRFLPGGPEFLTNNEEASGVIPAPFLGSGTYLIDVQNHASSPDPELVEGGQLLVLRIPPGKPVS